jgi:hypothetical protein
MAQMISAQLITRSGAWVAYRSIYPLASLEKNKILSDAYLGGVGLRHLYIEQGYLETTALIEHIRQNGRLGQMMWIAIQWAQVTAGMGFPLRGAPERFLPLAVGKWISALRDFFADSEFTFEIVNTYAVCLLRVHGRITMDDVLAGWYTNSEIQAINRCRLSLQVECLSNICTADGVSLDPGIQGKTSTLTSNEHDQVAMSRVSRSALVDNMAPIHTRDSSSSRLCQILGSWTQPNLQTWTTTHPHNFSARKCLQQL